jgi:L-amino acid N-acyltransferase YncA
MLDPCEGPKMPRSSPIAYNVSFFPTSVTMPITVRPETAADMLQIHRIFIHYILNTVASFPVQEPPVIYISSRFEEFSAQKSPYLVAVSDSDDNNGRRNGKVRAKVVGCPYVAPFRGQWM